MNSLAARIAIVTVVLVSLAVTIAIGATWLMSQRIASEAVSDSLEATQAMQRYLQTSRARELALTTDLLAADPHDTAYLVEATRGQFDDDEEIDLRSILDLVDDRRREMGFDFAMMLDANGQVLVHTDRPDAGGRMLGDHPMVATVMDDLIPDYGPWREGSRLFNVAVVPLATAFEVIGYLVTGLAIDDDVAADIKRVTGIDVAFVSLEEEREQLGASTLDMRQGEQLFGQLADSGDTLALLRAGQPVSRLDIDLGGEAWVARLEPISAPGGEVLGAAIAIDSLDARLAGFRTLQTALISGGALAILVALALSLLVARRIARPVGQLAAVADQAAQGDYEQSIDIRRRDEVGTLARAINRLLADLREQQEIAGYVTDLSRQLEEHSAPSSERTIPDPAGEVGSGPAWLAGIEWPNDAGGWEASLPDLVGMASRHQASLVPGGAARVLLVIESDRTDRLTGLLSDLLGLTAHQDDQPGLALAYGNVDSARLELGSACYPILSGKAVTHIEVLLHEAGPGRMLVSPAASKQLKPLIEADRVETAIVDGRSGRRRFHQVLAVAASDDPDATTTADVAPITRPRTVLAEGHVLGERFEILEALGEGAMGSVYRARDHKLDDVVALKLLKPSLGEDPEYLERMKSEIRLARRITHSNVLRTHDFFELDGLPVISMEYVRGVTLDQLLERSGRLSLAAGLRVSAQVLKGLQAAHDAGVLHRDIKPGNIILDPRGNARLMDFGIARQAVDEGKDLTQAGAIVGTANYMAPEVLLGEIADVRSDIYSTGVMMHQLFTGRLPFSGKTSMEVCMAHVQKDPAPPSEYWPEIPTMLETIILDCMAKKPEQRPASARVLLEQLLKVRREAG
ncbi:protein kinase [Wenzhouxiangella sp. AB-CW3]|uniref:protein kinase domain-containing protein n=1 Tax=Wenzhouxiangella sp. AB-CW3 TaxID=2771012 RepID=UPI00168B3092|nr:protein kinase [Wenzhouxiangella sp. AB-CW3]QOC23641.1 protein kinase [Wenzhouxiangella sp. AB-CW3]